MMRVGRACVSLCFALGFLWAAPAAHAQEQTNNGSVFLVISLTDSFDTSGNADFPFDGTSGSDTIIVNIGTMIGGAPSPRGARFQPASITTIPLPGEFTFTSLQGNDATIFGSFQTDDLETITPHVVTPTATDVDPAIQAAVFASSADLAAAINPNNDGSPFKTTGQIAQIVFNHLPEGSDIGLEQVAAAIFDTDVTLAASTTCEAEGDLFPHQPDEPLFHFAFSFDEDGTFDALDVCLSVDIDVKPGKSKNAIHLNSKGKVKIAILSSDTFDATDTDPCTVQIGGVFAVKTKVKDVNKDGMDDLVCSFKISDLVCSGVVDKDTTELTLTAFLFDDTCIEGTDAVEIHTHKAKKGPCDCDDEDDDDDGKDKDKGKK